MREWFYIVTTLLLFCVGFTLTFTMTDRHRANKDQAEWQVHDAEQHTNTIKRIRDAVDLEHAATLASCPLQQPSIATTCPVVTIPQQAVEKTNELKIKTKRCVSAWDVVKQKERRLCR